MLPCRSCYMVFPCLQVALGLSCLMGLVMFACYSDNSPLIKQYVTSKDQVSVMKIFFYLFTMHPTGYIFFNFFLYIYVILNNRWSYTLSWTCCRTFLDCLDCLLHVYSVHHWGMDKPLHLEGKQQILWQEQITVCQGFWYLVFAYWKQAWA